MYSAVIVTDQRGDRDEPGQTDDARTRRAAAYQRKATAAAEYSTIFG